MSSRRALFRSGHVQLSGPPGPGGIRPAGGGHGHGHGHGGSGRGRGHGRPGTQPLVTAQLVSTLAIMSSSGGAPVLPPVKPPVFVASAETGPPQGASPSIAIPAGLAAGDLLIIKLDYENSLGATNNSASATGFTSSAFKSVQDDYIQALTRVLNGSESYIGSGGTLTVTFSGTDASSIFTRVLAIGYRGVAATFFETATTLSSTSASSYSQGYTTSHNQDLLLQMVFARFSGGGSITFSSPTGSTTRQNSNAFGAGKSGFNESAAVSPPGSVTAAASWGGLSNLVAIIVGLRAV